MGTSGAGHGRRSVRRVALAVATGALLATPGLVAARPAVAATLASPTCTDSSGEVTCTLPVTTGTDAVDLSSLALSLAADGVSGGSPMWIQAWGGSGGHGGGYDIQASGGLGGYAQMVTTLDDLEAAYGTSTLYYYVGNDGLGHGSTHIDSEAGDGGASTLVATNDLFSTAPSIDVADPTAGNVVLLAGGGGGGAGESFDPSSVGDGGGAGGVAVSTFSGSATGDGGSATEKNGSVNGEAGKGGQCPDGGAAGTSNGGSDGQAGGTGIGGTGGGGGENSTGHFGSTSWVNVSSPPSDLTAPGYGGYGGAGTYDASKAGYRGAGGGGGGGYGGGGGGASTYSDDPGGGGGGCSFAARSLDSDALAPAGYVPDPTTGSGGVQVTFDAVGTSATFTVPAPPTPPDGGNGTDGTGKFTAHYKVATSSGTKTFYASGGTLSGAWDQTTETLTSAGGDVSLESATGKALTQVVAVDAGASITPVAGGTACPSGDSEYSLSGEIAVTDVPVFGEVSGTADLTGCGSITGTVTYNGSLSDLSPSDITSATVAGLELDFASEGTAGPSALAFTSDAKQIAPSASATTAMTVQLQDSTGAPVTTDTALTVDLASSSGTGNFAATTGGSAVSSVTVPADSSSVTFSYGDDTDGASPVVTASSGGLVATQTEYVAGGATTVVFTTSPVSGATSSSADLGPISATFEDAQGVETTEPGGDAFMGFSCPSSESCEFAKSAGGSTESQHLTLTKSTTVQTTSEYVPGPYTVYLGSNVAGTKDVRVRGIPDLNDTSVYYTATQDETVASAGTSEVSAARVGSDGGVYVVTTGGPGGFYGSLPGLGVHVDDIVGADTVDGTGYLLAGADGGAFAFGDVRFFGSMGGSPLDQPVVGVAALPDGQGYWEVARDGGVFAFGTAPFLGSLPQDGIASSDVVGIVATADGAGYWLVSADGGVFAFGDAPFLGSMGGRPLDAPVAGMRATPDGAGYWLVSADGGVFAFGDAPFLGSMGGRPLDAPVAGIVADRAGTGYWLLARDGGVFAFGDAPFLGSLPGLGIPVDDIVGAVPTAASS